MEEEKSRTSLRKSYDGRSNMLVVALSACWMLFQIAVASQVIFLAPHRLRVIHLCFAIVTILLLTPVSRKSNLKKLGIFDVLLALAAICVFAAVYFRYSALIRMGGRHAMIDIYLGIAVVFLLFEAARRVISPPLTVLTLTILLYVFLGNYLSGELSHPGFSLSRIVRHICVGGEGIFGFALGVSSEIIAVFVLFGAIMQEVGVANFFMDFSNAIAGKQRGGPAKVVVVASSLVATVTGETSANIATTGTFTIPMMKKVGYSDNFAGAVECAASAGGQILPPIMGATAFMLADTIGIPYVRVALAALLPAILYFTSVFAVVHFRSIRLDLKGMETIKPDWINLLKRSYLMMPLVAIVVLLGRHYTPTFSAFWGGIVFTILISFLSKDTLITPKRLLSIAAGAAKTIMTLSVATAMVGVIVGVFSLTGISMTMARMIFTLAGDVKLLILIVTMIVTIVIGLGLPTSAAYVLSSISAAPALAMAGIDILPAHFFVFYFGCMSAITPPVATGAYTAAALSGGSPNSISFIAMRLAVAGFVVPFLFIYQPDLLLGENTNLGRTAFIFLMTFASLVFFSAASEGAFFARAGIAKRLLYLLVALALVWPGNAFISAGSIALAIGVLVMEYLQYQRTKSALHST